MVVEVEHSRAVLIKKGLIAVCANAGRRETCRCLGDSPSTHGGLRHLAATVTAE